MATLKYKNPATSAWETLDALPAIGQAVEITATELTGKSTADRAAMYAAGTRLLKVVNGDTEVLLGLDADGSTEWMGSNKPLNNLLDNSDFTNPVNQRGATTYVTNNAYTIDRWILEGTTCWVTSTLVSIATGSYLVQRILGNKMSNTKTYTLATMDSSGSIKVGASAGMILFDDGTYGFNTIKIAAGEYLWAALYEGSYTADTLPPYTPKGYAVELAECMRYYQIIKSGFPIVGTSYTTGTSSANVRFPLPIKMRVNPSVTADATQIGVVDKGNTPLASSANFSMSNNSLDMSLTFSSAVFEKSFISVSPYSAIDIQLSADL